MTRSNRHPTISIAAFLVLALLVVACGPGVASTAPSAVPSASAAASSAAPTVPSLAPSPSASAAVPPSAAAACTSLPQTGTPPSDRLTNITVDTGAASDRLTFVFGAAALTNPGGPPRESLAIATPPYTQAGSGAPIAVTGDHVLQLTFTGMSLQNDAGEEMFTGPTEVKPALPALRHVVRFDASEGVMGWYIGYAGSGCVTLGQDGSNLTVTIDHS